MANEIIPTPNFEKKYKRFAKKFTSFKNDIDFLTVKLLKKPTIGEPLGSGLYKIRLAIASKGGGKSGGFRVVTYLVKPLQEQTDIYLVDVYDKSEESTVQKSDLLKLIKKELDNTVF